MMRELRSCWPLCLVTLILCALCCSHLSEARHHRQKPTAVVVGAVYCDTCLQDDTSKGSHYISGATVAVKCAKESTRPAFQKEVKTDKQGKFKVELPFSVSKHVKKVDGCTVKLVKSSEPFCAVASTATSSSIHLKRRNKHQHIYSAGLFTFKPLKQPGVCNQQPSVLNSQLDSIMPDPATPTLPKPNTPNLPKIPHLPSLPPPPGKTPYSKDSEVDQPQQLFPPIVPPVFTPPQGPLPLPPNPLQPPGLLPNPLQPPPSPLIPNPLQPPTPPPGLLPPTPPLPSLPLPPIPGLTPPIPGLTPPVPTTPPSLLPPTPPLPSLPLPPVPGLTPPVPTTPPSLLPPTPPLPNLPLPPVPGLTPPPVPTTPPASSLPLPPIIPVPPGIGGSPLIPGVPPVKAKKVNHP